VPTKASPATGSLMHLADRRGSTPVVCDARSLGRATADGWRVLLAQAAQSFGIWPGQRAPFDAMTAGMEAG